MNVWETIFIAVGGNAALLVLLGWLARSFGAQLLAKDLEKFKMELSAATSNASEHLKHELQKTALEHQVRFSKLHERRGEVVAEIYSLLVEAHWAIESFVSPMEWVGEPSKKEKYLEAYNKPVEFFRYFDKHRIYLPQELCDQLEAFMRGMRTIVIGFGTYVQIEHPNEKTDCEKQKIWAEAYEYMDKEAPKARAALEAELRKLLGA